MKKKWILPLCIVAGVLVLLLIGAIVFVFSLGVSGYTVTSGRMLWVSDSPYIVTDDSGVMYMSDNNKTKDLFNDIKTGDSILVVHGGVEESYPAFTDAYYVLKLKTGDEKDIKDVEKVVDTFVIEDTEYDEAYAPDSDAYETTYCRTVQTTIYFENGEQFSFTGEDSVTLTDILTNLKYDKNKLCKCLPEYTVETEFGTCYGVRLSGDEYARCDEGQAAFSDEQASEVKRIILWAESKAKGSGNG